ncbi:MAG: response regulator [Lachnospiraceae bacterium]|nr:response regulator [Lachnospiraceae bacterium]
MERRKMNIALTLLVIFVLMILVVVYTTRLFLRISVSNITEVGEDKASSLAVSLENYLDTAKSVLWVVADTVDEMVKNGDDPDRIQQYLIGESKNQEQQFDENYTGLYGYIQGEYLDGVGWFPPEGYDPTQRDWYLAARKANGESTIVSPYVDAQTGAVIISFSRQLSDGESVLSLDVTMNEIQTIVQGVTIKGKGYSMIVNEDGMIIAHRDASMNGQYIGQLEEYEEVAKHLQNNGVTSFQADIHGQKCTVFVADVLNQWNAVIIVENEELYGAVKSQLIVNVLVYLISFGIMSLVCFIAYRSVIRNSRRIEELKINEQKQEYEAKVLRLEKTAADAANKAKGDFLAEMSHEIRTPINAVLGMNEMILRESSEKNVRQYAENIQVSGKTLLSIVNDILDFSKIEDGKMELVPVSYDLAGLILNLVNSIQGRAQAKNLEFEVEVDEKLPSVLQGDDVRITQIIMNLLTNAVKYTEQGKVTFTVRQGGRTRVDDHDYVLLDVSVKDTGIGIKEEDRKKLFESFERLEEKRNRNIEGTGLGMAIVVKLLSMMGSEIHLDSVYGKGSVFSFRLQQRIMSDQPIGDYAEHVTNDERRQREKTYLYAPNARVLLVDDNAMNLEVAKNLLKRNGITPDLVASGSEAIERIRVKRYDIVFLDHMMPRMDGIETLAKLREEGLFKKGGGTVVIALTANAVVGARETYLSAGFDDYLSKPIDAKKLEDQLCKYLPKELQGFCKDTRQQEMPEENDDDFSLEFLPGEGEVMTPDMSKKPVDQVLEEVRKLGLDVDKGLVYCADDEAFYVSMLDDYATAFDEKSRDLKNLYGQKDWKEYRVLIHAIKSNSKTIGAEDLSERARLLEEAASQENMHFLNLEHGNFMKEYEILVRNLRHVL